MPLQLEGVSIPKGFKDCYPVRVVEVSYDARVGGASVVGWGSHSVGSYHYTWSGDAEGHRDAGVAKLR